MYFSKLKLFASVFVPAVLSLGGSGGLLLWRFKPEIDEVRGKLQLKNTDLKKLKRSKRSTEIQLQGLFNEQDLIQERLDFLKAQKSSLEKLLEELSELEKGDLSREQLQNLKIKQRHFNQALLEILIRIQEETKRLEQAKLSKDLEGDQIKRIGQLSLEIDSLKGTSISQQGLIKDRKEELDTLETKTQRSESVISEQTRNIQSGSKQLEGLEETDRLQISRLAASYKSILLDSSKDYDFSDVKTRKKAVLISKSVDGDSSVSSFSIKDKNSEERFTFNFQKTKETLIPENTVNRLKKTADDILDSKFDQWNKTFTLFLYNLCWSCEEGPTLLHNPVNSSHSFDLNQIFRNEYIQYAAKVLFFIHGLDNTLVEKQSNNYLKIQRLSLGEVPTEKALLVPSWKIKDGKVTSWTVWSGSFYTKEDFEKYLIMKTYELATYKNVDFSDLLNPMFKSSSYE